MRALSPIACSQSNENLSRFSASSFTNIRYLSDLGVNEGRAFDFFKECTSTPLGFGLGWGAWSALILQSSEADPTLRHAVIALGALHEKTVYFMRLSLTETH